MYKNQTFWYMILESKVNKSLLLAKEKNKYT